MSDQEKKPQEEHQQRQSYYYDEKTEEKVEKEDEKYVEKHESDPLGSLAWALILIWAGLAFLASNLGWLDQIQIKQALPEGLEFIGLSTWSVIFLGAGVIVFIEAIIRTFVPAYRSSLALYPDCNGPLSACQRSHPQPQVRSICRQNPGY